MPPVQTHPASSSTAGLTRPKSSSSLALPPTTSGFTPYVRPSAPYMVALSGWPEPVYIAHANHRSRPTTPSFPAEVRDGIRLSAPSSPRLQAAPALKEREKDFAAIPPEQSIFSKTCMYNSDPNEPCPIPGHPNHVAKYAYPSSKSRPGSPTGDSPFPTSSARGTPHPSPPSSSRPLPTPTRPPTREAKSGFRDPRLAPHVAVMHNRPALPIAPNWSSSPPAQPLQTGVGVKVTAGQRGPGILVMRAVPDVYPPPAPAPGMAGMAAGMTRGGGGAGRSGVGMATEVYPRDPDSAFLWGSSSAVHSRSTSVGAEGEEGGMEVEEGRSQ